MISESPTSADDEDDWPRKRHTADEVPPDDGRLARATVLVYALAIAAIAAAIALAIYFGKS
ncbi:MAG: hypothetical protein JO035_10140 [Betaproteobacteria bacterium]|nr:hypothetical protein [Betaproteobacteria bacterium]